MKFFANVQRITHFYRPQTKFAKVMFLQVSVCPQGGVCMVAPRGGVHGCSRGACMVVPRGRAWLLQGACMFAPGGHGWDMMRYGDTINERAVRILLECILVTLILPLAVVDTKLRHIRQVS